MSRPEALFQSEVVESLRTAGYHVVEIPDDAKKQYRFGQRVAASAKPYDLGVADGEKYIALELKHEDSATWNFAKLTASEHVGLEDALRVCGYAFVLIRFQFRPGPRQQKEFPQRVVDEAWALPYESLRKLEKLAYKSLFLSDARIYAHEVLKTNSEEAPWNLKRLFCLPRSKHSGS